MSALGAAVEHFEWFTERGCSAAAAWWWRAKVDELLDARMDGVVKSPVWFTSTGDTS